MRNGTGPLTSSFCRSQSPFSLSTQSLLHHNIYFLKSIHRNIPSHVTIHDLSKWNHRSSFISDIVRCHYKCQSGPRHCKNHVVIERKYLWPHFYFLLNTHSHNGWHFRYGNLMTFKTSLVSYEMEVIGSGSIWKYKNERCAEVSTWNLNDKLDWGQGQMLWFFFFGSYFTLDWRLCVENMRKNGVGWIICFMCYINWYLLKILHPGAGATQRQDRSNQTARNLCIFENPILKNRFFNSNPPTTSSILCLDISILLPIVVLLRSDKVLTYAQKIMII